MAYHLVNGVWEEIQGFVIDNGVIGQAICFRTTSFSWFAAGVNSQVPSADAGAPPEVACNSSEGALVTLDGSRSVRPDGGILNYLWTGSFGAVAGIAPIVQLPVGRSEYTLQVNDGVHYSDTSTGNALVSIQVTGLEPPFGPLTTDEVELPILPMHSFKAGRTLPLRLTLSCGIDTLSDQLVVPPEIIAVTRTGDVLDLGTLDLDSGQSASSTPFFRYENGSWIYNLSTQGFLPGTYQIDIQMPDGIERSAGFVLR
jgi:hypothetical protein